MAVSGQATDRGMSGMTSRDKGNYKYKGLDFVEGHSSNGGGRSVNLKSDGLNLSKALSGHSLASNNHPAKQTANSYGSQKGTQRKNQPGIHPPNTNFQGQNMPHGDVQTAPGKVLGKTVRQGRNTYGPNIQFQGADHRHDGVKTSGS